jgi:hypothetical protein
MLPVNRPSRRNENTEFAGLVIASWKGVRPAGESSAFQMTIRAPEKVSALILIISLLPSLVAFLWWRKPIRISDVR